MPNVAVSGPSERMRASARLDRACDRAKALNAPAEKSCQVYRTVVAGRVCCRELLDRRVFAAQTRCAFLVAIEAHHHVTSLLVVMLQQPIGSEGGQDLLAQREQLPSTLDEGRDTSPVSNLPYCADGMTRHLVPRTPDRKEDLIDFAAGRSRSAIFAGNRLAPSAIP